jgi:hypothetical protein
VVRSALQPFPAVPHCGLRADLANGINAVASAKVPTGIIFAGFLLTGVCILNASGGGAVDGAQLAKDGGPTLASNTMYSASLVTVQIASSNGILNNTPIPFPAMVGTAESPFILPAPYYLNGGEEFSVTFANGSGIAIDATLVIWGRRVATS